MMAPARVRVADQCRPDGTPRRPRLAVDLVSPEWVPAVGPIGTVKKEFTAYLGDRQIGRLLLYREVDGTFDISGIGVRDIHQGQGVASQLLDFAFEETNASHFTLSTGTTGDGTLLVLSYGEGRRDGRRVVERPARLAFAPSVRESVGEHAACDEDELTEVGETPR